MIYTIGYRKNYDEALDGGGTPIKMGRHIADDETEYLGGAAFETAESAEGYIMSRGLKDFGVYGLKADWHEDTYQIEGEPFHRLIRDAGLVRLLH